MIYHQLSPQFWASFFTRFISRSFISSSCCSFLILPGFLLVPDAVFSESLSQSCNIRSSPAFQIYSPDHQSVFSGDWSVGCFFESKPRFFFLTNQKKLFGFILHLHQIWRVSFYPSSDNVVNVLAPSHWRVTTLWNQVFVYKRSQIIFGM